MSLYIFPVTTEPDSARAADRRVGEDMSTKSKRAPRAAAIADAVVVTEEELRQRRPISVYRAAKLASGRGEHLCVVKSISSRSFVAESHARVAPGERVRIELGDRMIAATITALEARGIAAVFDETIDVQAWLGAEGTQHRRTAPRIAIDARARLQIGNQLLFVRARDISQEGLGVETRDMVMGGDALIVGLRGWHGPIPGAITRIDGDFAGIHFLQPLSFQALSEWLGAYGGSASAATGGSAAYESGHP